MKKFMFRLERILRLKRQSERQAELGQRQAHLRLDIARSEQRNVQTHLEQQASGMAARTGQLVHPDTQVAGLQYLAQLEQKAAAADLQVRKAEQALREASAHRLRIHREAESVAWLRSEQWESHQRETARDAQEWLDEASLQRWHFASPTDSAGTPTETEFKNP